MDFIVNVFEDIFGVVRKYNESTSQVAFDCPACALDKNLPEGDGKGNLEINYKKNKYRCWSCQDVNQMHGSLHKLIKKYGTAKNQRDFLLLIPDTLDEEEKEYVEIDLKLPEGFIALSDCKGNEYKYGQVMSYLKERGIGSDIIKEFGIGYTTRGKFFNRVIIPSINAQGKLNYFIARWFAKEFTKLKYLNPDEVEKQKIIFNEGRINWDATIYLVEGATDHIVTPNSIPILGKYLSLELIDMLYEKANGYIVILLDSDAYDDAKSLYKQLNFGKLYGRIRICKVPEGYDPSKIYEKLGRKGIVKLMKSADKLSELEY